ncbi:MAG: hypothetical protein QG637_446 [Chloroflexota bacterium]|nr:hypothetical protein [Chloroflexota bacterium]
MLPTLARQVHLDFHTSEQIPEVGARFDKAQWQEALKLGRVNWINIFAKCHHGWSYYPTAVGAIHPTLKFDLLGAQIAACHEIGVRAPIYYTVGWSVHDTVTHPEWCVRREDGGIAATNWDENAKPADRKPNFAWQFMCPSGGYLDLMLRQTAEICQRYPTDGLWYDITGGPPCYCENCRRGMAAGGYDAADPEAVFQYGATKWRHFYAACRKTLYRYHPEATIFFNGTTVLHADTRGRNITARLFDDNSQQELEDLPTTWGGYDKLPLRAKFFHNTGKPLIAMSGKFHTSWGEFGGFKHPDALRFEAGAMLAFGAACNFGDQLHPSGEMDLATYANIGQAFAYVEQLEEYGLDAVPAANLGLWFANSKPDDEGAAVMLLETQTDFLVVDPAKELTPYAAIILPGAACLSAGEAARLNAYVAGGGSLLVLGESALDEKRERFVLDVGAEYLGPASYDEDFTVGSARLNSVIARSILSGTRRGVPGEVEGADAAISTFSPFLNYEAALRAQPHAGTEVLATLREPYFNRTFSHFCSHQNTPNRLEVAPHPAALRKGRVIFLPHRLGKLYHEHGARVHRDFFANALSLIYTRPMAQTRLPSAGRVSLMHQPGQRRYVAHLLYGAPLQRGRCLVIEDLPALHDVPLTVRVPQTVRAAYLVPGRAALPMQPQDGGVSITVPVLQGHQAIVFEY